jgi:hypothetical protein
MAEYETPLIIDDVETEPELSPPKTFNKKKPSPNIEGYNENPNYWNLVFLTNTRNGLLNSTDKFVLPDYNITPENLEIIKSYRQMLRDFININKEFILSGGVVEIPSIPI